MVTVKCFPALHHSKDFIFKSFGIIDSILELLGYLRVIDEAQLAELANLVQKSCTLDKFQFFLCDPCFQRITLL